MEKKEKGAQGAEVKVVWFLKALLCAFFLSAILLLILSVLLYRMNLDEGKVTIGIVMIYIASTFLGGFLIGKMAGKQKFIWGFVTGVLYFAMLLLISLGVYHSLQDNGKTILTTFLLCAAGGTLGGMLS